MKQITLFLCPLLFITAAHAGKNKKPAPVQEPAQPALQEQPKRATTDKPSDVGYWEVDQRMMRTGYVAPDSADIIKYGLTKPAMPTTTK